MGLLDVLTGGKNKSAEDALKRAEAAFSSIQAPTAQQLTLPELQKYVQAGILTPAQAQTFLIQGNAYNDINLPPESREAQIDAINKLKAISDTGGMDDSMKAQLTEALDKVATNTHGTNASILDQMSQRGIPTSLMGTAAQLAASGDAARDANLTATQAAGQAEQNAINAMLNEGNLASTLHGQESSEAQKKAEAENALRTWNAGASNTASEANAGRTQAANLYNTENAQDITNKNVDIKNKRTEYNTGVPQTVFDNAIRKASGQAGVNQAQANQYSNQGNQMLGLFGAATGAAANAFAPGSGSVMQASAKPPAGYNPNYSYDMLPAAHGAIVPGEAIVPGDSPANDTVHARLSPGEIVVPRSIAPHPEAVKRFVQHLAFQKQPKTPVHPDDVHSVLEALTKRRAA